MWGDCNRHDMSTVLIRFSFRVSARLNLPLLSAASSCVSAARLFRSSSPTFTPRSSSPDSTDARFSDYSDPLTAITDPLPHSMPSSTLSSRPFDLVVAATQRGGIGNKGDLPWGRALKGDLSRFKQLTTTLSPPSSPTAHTSAPSSPVPSSPAIHNAVLMGRKTWESIPAHIRPLKGRVNVIITVHQAERIKAETSQHDKVLIASSLPDALTLLSSPRWNAAISNVFVIGGASLIREALASPSLQHIHLTQVLKDVECDTFIPAIAASQSLHLDSVSDVTVESGIPYQFLTFHRTTPSTLIPATSFYVTQPRRAAVPVTSQPHPIHRQSEKADRTGVGTLSLFGEVLRFDLNRSFPLLTTKRVFFPRCCGGAAVAHSWVYGQQGASQAQGAHLGW